jgi:hypothetical protein
MHLVNSRPQTWWNSAVDTFGTDPYIYRSVGSFIWLQFFFLAFGGIFIFLDMTLSPHSLRKYKSQPRTNEPLDRAKFSYVRIISNWSLIEQ